MSRKLIPLTAEISNSESLFNLTSWRRNENFPASFASRSCREPCEIQPAGKKVKMMVTKWNGTKKSPQKADNEKFEIFLCSQNGPEDLATKVIGII